MGVSAAVEVSIAARPDRRRDATSHTLETRPSPCSTDSPSAPSPPPICNTVVPTPGHRPRHAHHGHRFTPSPARVPVRHAAPTRLQAVQTRARGRICHPGATSSSGSVCPHNGTQTASVISHPFLPAVDPPAAPTVPFLPITVYVLAQTLRPMQRSAPISSTIPVRSESCPHGPPRHSQHGDSHLLRISRPRPR